MDKLNFRYRLETGAMRFALWLMPLLPRKGCVTLANVLGTLGFWLDAKGRAVSLSNLEVVFGDRYTEAERKVIARKSYQNLARTFLDLFWTPRLLKEPHWVRYEDPHGALGDKQVIAVSLHAAGFEWSGIGLGLVGRPMAFLAQDFKNKNVGQFFHDLRQVSGNVGVNRRGGILKMLKQLQKGLSVVMLTDLTVDPRMPSTAVKVGGLWMSATIIHAALHQRTGLPIVPGTYDVNADGSTVAYFHKALEIPPNATAHEIVQICWNFFWPVIESKPEYWMWSYKHWRFKPVGAVEKYPIYANESERFSKLIAQEQKDDSPGLD